MVHVGKKALTLNTAFDGLFLLKQVQCDVAQDGEILSAKTDSYPGQVFLKYDIQ